MPADMPADVRFPIYSITKTFTAICVLRLSEIGALRIGDAAKQWLPEMDLPATITLTHLLHHTSGLGDYGPLPEYHAAVRAHPDRPWTRQHVLDAVLSRGMLFAPGDRWSYSNVGYMLLVDILERVSGQTFARVLDDLLIAPLALQRTSVLTNIEDLMDCVPGFGSELTADHTIVDVRGRYHPGWCAPRVVASTADETTRVFDALLAGHLLTADSLAKMLTTVPLPGSREDGLTIGSAMGVYSVRSSRWGLSYAHGGGGPGYDLDAAVFPDSSLGRVSIAVFVNSSCGPRARDCNEMLLAQLLAPHRQ